MHHLWISYSIYLFMCAGIVIDKQIWFSIHQKGSVTNEIHQIYSQPRLCPVPLGKLITLIQITACHTVCHIVCSNTIPLYQSALVNVSIKSNTTVGLQATSCNVVTESEFTVQQAKYSTFRSMTHAPETGAIDPLHFSGADIWCVVQNSDRILLVPDSSAD